MFQIIAKTLAGLEEILANEIENIGGINIAIGTRMVTFVGDKKMLYKANLWLRTALRVLKPVERFEASSSDELYEKVKAIDWTKYVNEGQTIAIDETIFSENFRNSRYAIYRCKDAICDFFTEHNMKRPKISVASADVQLNLHITDEGGQEGSACTISLDSSGEPLYKRGYKQNNTEAPISEVLAAGILLKAGWDGSRDLIDPMCGSGTFLIEAALIATNTPAGLFRKNFGFERWAVGENAFDRDIWQELYDDDSNQKDFTHHIYGSDISKLAIDVTENNIKASGLARYISLEQKDFEEYQTTTHPAMNAYNEALLENPQAPAPMLVFNPPYGKRLIVNVQTFYGIIGTTLKKGFSGTEAWIIASESKVKVNDAHGNKVEAEPFEFVGLKPSVKISLNNGGIICELRKYEMFKGKFQEFRADGGELKKKTADQEGKKHEKLEYKYAKKGDKKPFDKEKKPFKKDFDKGEKKFDKDKKHFDKDKKPFDKDKKHFDKDKKPFRKDFNKGEKKFDKKPSEHARKPRSFDPKRPMFGEDFNMSAHVLDFSDDKK